VTLGGKLGKERGLEIAPALYPLYLAREAGYLLQRRL
jgi:hypothetical protein